MLKHIVLFTMKETENGSASDHARTLQKMLEALPGHIPQIHYLEAGINQVTGDAAAHVSLYSVFANEQALDQYKVHPEHQKVVAFIQATTRERRFVDYNDDRLPDPA